MSALSEIVVASHNAGKLREIEALLAPLSIRVTSAAALNLPEPEETGDTFEANALLRPRRRRARLRPALARRRFGPRRTGPRRFAPASIPRAGPGRKKISPPRWRA